jgi:hypothetical protein
MCVLVLFIYARSRVGPVLNVAAAVAILFLSPAWQDIVWLCRSAA